MASKKEGLRYEKELATQLASRDVHSQTGLHVTHGPWFEYWDSRGSHFCQPDILLRADIGSPIFVLECKRSLTGEAFRQLEELYVPILECVYEAKVFGFVVTKNLRQLPAPPVPLVVGTLREALRRVISGPVVPIVFHWLGNAAQLVEGFKLAA